MSLWVNSRRRATGVVMLAAFVFLTGNGCGGGEKSDEASRGEGGEKPIASSQSQGGSSGAQHSGNRSSVPLTLDLFQQTALDSHTYRFEPGISGRKVQDEGRIAVEWVRFSLSTDTTRVWTLSQMDSLSGAGAIGTETSSFPVFTRAIISGDSATVAATLEKGKIDWYKAPRAERYSIRGLHPKFAERAGSHKGHAHEAGDQH